MRLSTSHIRVLAVLSSLTSTFSTDQRRDRHMQDIVIYLTFLDDRVGRSCTIGVDSWSAYGLDLIFS
jgi:hypothetical protein